MLAEFLLTAYHLGCDAPGPYTKTGTRPRSGRTVAVDPQVIPLGSVLEIEGLGFRIAEDIGGGVRGHRIDVYLGSCKEARMFGRQKRKVQVHLRGARRGRR